MKLWEVFNRAVPIVISKASPPEEGFHICEVFKTDDGEKIVALIRGKANQTTSCMIREAFSEAYQIDACNACVFQCSYGRLEGEGDWSERSYTLRFLGSARLGSRLCSHEEICDACFQRESERVKKSAEQKLTALNNMRRTVGGAK